MLDNIKSNTINPAGEVTTPQTFNTKSSVRFLKKLENDEVKLKLTTTTDVLSDLMSNVVSILLNIEIPLSSNNQPIFILRDALFEQAPEEGSEQLVAMWRINQQNALKACLKAYQFAINNNINPNKAASILPIGNTIIEAELVLNTSCIMTASHSNLTSECTEILLMCQEQVAKNIAT